ncbi:MAG: ABC transporter permease [Clostridiaceae bacterium]|nr:ABC transporter permease [Clostridiaceae bacterium]
MIKKVYADLVNNKSKTFSIMLTMFVGLMAVGIVVMFSIFFVPEAYRAYYSAEPYDALIKSESFHSDILDEIQNFPDVKDVDGRNKVLARLDLGEKVLNANLIVMGRKNSINKIRRSDGTEKLLKLNENEIFLERATLVDINRKPGEKIKVVIDGRTEHELVIKDIVYDAVTEPYTIEGDAVAFINQDTLENLSGDRKYNEVMIKVAGDNTSKERNSRVINQVAKFMETKGIEVLEIEVPEPGVFYATQAMDAISIIMMLIGSLAILLGVSLIINIFNSMMVQHISQIGIMKAIGGSTAKISAMYFGMVITIGFVTFLVSLPLSAFVSYKVCEVLAGLLNMELSGFSIPLLMVILQFVGAVIVPLLATIAPVLRVTRTTIYDALNDNIKGASFKDIGVLNSLTKKFKYLPTSLLISLRNNFRSRLRVVLTLSTLILSGAILITALNLQKGFSDTIEDAKFLVPDGVLTLSSFENAQKIEEIAKGVEGVETAEGWAFSQARFMDKANNTSKKVRILGPTPDSEIFDYSKAEDKLLSGRLIKDDSKNEIVITNHLTDFYPDIKVGDTINLKIKDKEYAFEVVGIMGIFGRPSDPILLGGYGYLSQIYEGNGMVNDLRFSTFEDTEEYQNKVADKIEKELGKQGIFVNERNLGEAMLEQFSTSSSITVILLLFLSLMISCVGAIGLSGTLSLNVLERAKELGIMRSIGGDNKRLNTMIIAEGTILVLIAWFFSLFLSLPLTMVSNNMLGEALFATPLGFKLNYQGVVIWLVVSIIASFLAGLFPCIKINKMVTREVLAYQ